MPRPPALATVDGAPSGPSRQATIVWKDNQFGIPVGPKMGRVQASGITDPARAPLSISAKNKTKKAR